MRIKLFYYPINLYLYGYISILIPLKINSNWSHQLFIIFQYFQCVYISCLIISITTKWYFLGCYRQQDDLISKFQAILQEQKKQTIFLFCLIHVIFSQFCSFSDSYILNNISIGPPLIRIQIKLLFIYYLINRKRVQISYCFSHDLINQQNCKFANPGNINMGFQQIIIEVVYINLQIIINQLIDYFQKLIFLIPLNVQIILLNSLNHFKFRLNKQSIASL
ncbi:hypothetical protein pb186bvf_017482 [Paramecium bursaria]